MPKKATPREEKLSNLIMNHSLIFMSVFEEAFEEIAEKMTGAMSAAADALAKGVGVKELAPGLNWHISEAFSSVREEIESQWPKNPDVFRSYISGKAFDKGIEIVESYDFQRPKLTEKLSDESLASYVFLLKGGDAKASKMFRELAEWQKDLPRPPWAP